VTPSFLEGGGELGALMRAYDWTKTPLGPTEAWPESLRSALGLCLNSCPSLSRCEAWYLGLPKSKRPIGVIAGRLNPQERRPPGRPRNSAAS